MPKIKSNIRWEKFCLLKHEGSLSNLECYIGAGYKRDSKKHTVEVKANVMLNRPEIIARLVELKEQQAEKSLATTDEVIQSIKPIMNSDIIEFLTETKQGFFILKDALLLKEMDTRAIKAIKIRDKILKRADKNDPDEIIEQIVEIQLWDKNKSAELIGRYTGAFEKDNKQSQANVTINLNRSGLTDEQEKHANDNIRLLFGKKGA